MGIEFCQNETGGVDFSQNKTGGVDFLLRHFENQNYENLLSLGGHMAPLPENLRNMSGGPETWFGI